MCTCFICIHPVPVVLVTWKNGGDRGREIVDFSRDDYTGGENF